MPDYVYLLENRLSADQQNALRLLRDVAREAEMILFLTGDAVRDLTSGHAVRELEVALQGSPFKLKKQIQKVGGTIWGEDEVSKSLYLCFPGTVRVDLISTHRVEYKKPGQPIYHPAGIQDDLRRRDFTANAMAISLNEGSYGLLMDPLNGVADIEARAIRLVSNYGFIEDPSLLIRAVRYRTRLGWQLEPRTQARYDNAKEEDTIQYLSAHARSRELEQIGHEDDGLKVLQALDTEGWMKVLCPAWTPAKADVDKLNALHDLAVELLMQGVHADTSAAQMQLLTTKLNPKDLAGLKKSLLRPGFVEEWNNLDSMAAGFAKVLQAKQNQTPSVMYKLFMSYDPEAVLWLGFTTKDAGIKQRYQNFLKVWPEKRQQIPYALMQEMRIRPELQDYNEILQAIFLQLIDGHLTTPEEMRAFLEPYSPPAPPPQVTIRRPRGKRAAEAKIKEPLDEDEESEVSEEDLDDMGGDEDEIELPKIHLDGEDEEEELEHEGEDESSESEDDEEEEEKASARGRKSPKVPPPAKPAKAIVPAAKSAAPAGKPTKQAAAPAAKPAQAAKPAAAKAVHIPHIVPKPAAKSVPTKATKQPIKSAAPGKSKPVAPAKKASQKAAKPAVKKAVLKPASKPAHKSVTRAAAKATKAKHVAVVKAKAPKAKPSPKLAKVTAKVTVKAKPHKAAKPSPKKNAAKPTKKAAKSSRNR